MRRIAIPVLLLLASTLSAASLADSFAQPPDEVRPWVWGHWSNGNVSEASLTTDLEAMKRVGLGGVCLFDVDQGVPAGPNAYLDDGWRRLFSHAAHEAGRLGLDLAAHAGPGWSGNGGPWITPDNAMQTLVFSATPVPGGKPFNGLLAQPKAQGDYYRDVAVLAVAETPEQAAHRIKDFDLKRVWWRKWIDYRGIETAPVDATTPAAVCIPRDRIVDLTGRMAADGRIAWDAPTGTWTLLRFGHTSSGQMTSPAPLGGKGLECDKLDKKGIRAHFEQAVARLIAAGGPAAGGKLQTLFVDSWEAGGQDWTARMPEEFRARRGYDLIPFLPIMAGRVVGDLQTTERFLWDLRQTVSELVTENFWAEFSRLAHERGMRLCAQAYITTGNDLDAANHVDEPSGECWAVKSGRYLDSIKTMASAANLNNRPLVPVEAFTADADERWLLHPGAIKALGDRMFCTGGNKFMIHRYAMQRFADLKPGIAMGPWGLHYERTQIWWEWTRPWHDYLARCQLLLRQGRPVRDVLVVQPEEPLRRQYLTPIPGHDYDDCGPDSFRRVTVQDGQIQVTDGPRYRLLVVKHLGRMSVARARQILALVKEGAAILGEPPRTTPGLSGQPTADGELQALAAEMWGSDAAVRERRIGKGRVFRDMKPEEALAKLAVAPDLTSDATLSWTHRATGDTDIYFLASDAGQAVTAACTFRVDGRQAECWDAETGRTAPLPTTSAGPGQVRAVLTFAPSGSRFVVFRPGPQQTTQEPASTATVAGKTLPLDGPWQVSFPKDSGAPESLVFPALIPWNHHTDDHIRHCSGTATYRTTFTIAATTAPMILDLGRVEVMARVAVNGRDLGILWKQPFRIDISAAVQAGANQLQVAVVNLWVNRLIGDERLPDDAKRNPKGDLKEWPQWLLDGGPSPTGRQSFTTWKRWKKDEPLQDSGLIGPVVLVPYGGR